ncbi:MAG: ATP-binding cassette domain-containing protein [Clostridia bacterium]
MLQIQHVSLVHRKDLRTIVDDVSFSLQPGDKAVVIGEEGDGKSTLLKWIYDPALVHSYAQASGKRILHGNILGYLPQELTKAEKEMTIYEYYCHSPVFLTAPRKRWRISPVSSAYPRTFAMGISPFACCQVEKSKNAAGSDPHGKT